MKRFTRLFISSIIGCFSMMSLSYIWHGVVLNDIKSLQYDLTIFLGLLFLLYLFISLFLSFIVSIYNPKDNKLFKHTTIGVFFGFLVYLIAFVLGVSFSGGALNHIVVDFTWQMIEQAIGTLTISVYYTVVYRFDKVKKMESFD